MSEKLADPLIFQNLLLFRCFVAASALYILQTAKYSGNCKSLGPEIKEKGCQRAQTGLRVARGSVELAVARPTTLFEILRILPGSGSPG